MSWLRVGIRVGIGVVMLSVCLWVLASADPSSGSGSVLGSLDSGRASEIANRAAPAIVTVKAEGCEASVTGSGFVVDEMVVTNRHLVTGTELALVDGLGSGPERTMAVGAVAASLDLAIIPVGDGAGLGNGDGLSGQDEAEGAAAGGRLLLADADPQVGTGVVMVGRSNGHLGWLSGQVHLYTAGRPYGAAGTVMLIDPAASFGYSGGPVLDGDGRVVGILRAMDRTTGLAIAIPVSDLEPWLYGDQDKDPSTSCIGAG